MWCTRWYLPLVLLPLPIAPPYILVLFLFSTTLHAKPCFYCIILLTAMFMASCYWPPIPIDTPLRAPWSDNITTFADALLSRMPNLPADMLPATITVADRCWCELSTGFFEPFNTTRWEVQSVEMLRKELQQKLDKAEVLADRSWLDANVNTSGNSPPPVLTSPKFLRKARDYRSSLRGLWLFLTRPWAPHSTASKPADYSQTPLEPLSWLRKEYDLRPYGFDLVVDFRF